MVAHGGERHTLLCQSTPCLLGTSPMSPLCPTVSHFSGWCFETFFEEWLCQAIGVQLCVDLSEFESLFFNMLLDLVTPSIRLVLEWYIGFRTKCIVRCNARLERGWILDHTSWNPQSNVAAKSFPYVLRMLLCIQPPQFRVPCLKFWPPRCCSAFIHERIAWCKFRLSRFLAQSK